MSRKVKRSCALPGQLHPTGQGLERVWQSDRRCHDFAVFSKLREPFQTAIYDGKEICPFGFDWRSYQGSCQNEEGRWLDGYQMARYKWREANLQLLANAHPKAKSSSLWKSWRTMAKRQWQWLRGMRQSILVSWKTISRHPIQVWSASMQRYSGYQEYGTRFQTVSRLCVQLSRKSSLNSRRIWPMSWKELKWPQIMLCLGGFLPSARSGLIPMTFAWCKECLSLVYIGENNGTESPNKDLLGRLRQTVQSLRFGGRIGPIWTIFQPI